MIKLFISILLLLPSLSIAENELNNHQVIENKTEAYQFIEKIYSNYHNKYRSLSEAEKTFCPEFRQLMLLDE
jgi:muramidase (phage lysozyme)